MEKPVKRRDIVDLEIIDLSFHGKGVAKVDNYTIFVPDTIPGQRVKAKIKRAKKSYAEAYVKELLEKSPIEINADCKYFEHCGGCKHQNIPYEKQVDFFYKQITDLYTRMGGFQSIDINPIIKANKIYHYRNKMEFSFSNYRWLMGEIDKDKATDFALGLRASGNYWKAIDLDYCLLAPEETTTILTLVRNFVKNKQLQPYNQKRHEGFMRHLMVRKGFNTNQVMVNIVTQENKPALFKPLAEQLTQEVPNITSIIHTKATNKGGTTIPEEQTILYGRDYIEDKLGSLTYKISTNSFFQTNTLMAEKLYTEIVKAANVAATDNVWDLYCGTGSIGLFLADQAKTVTGIELNHSSVRDAIKNAENNQIRNVEFLHGNLDKLFEKEPELAKKLPSPDVLIVDPPRSGLHPKLVNQIIALAPKKMVYVSCNPATQVRDLKLFHEQGNYSINSVQPVDMFPHTPHIEVVTGLSL